MTSIVGLLKRPAGAALAGGILGLVLGLIWAWLIQPVEWKDATPALLHPAYREEYLRMVIDSYGLHRDVEAAQRRYQALGEVAPSVLQNIQANPAGQDPVVILEFSQQVAATVPSPSVPAEQPSSAGQGKTGGYLLVMLAVLAMGLVMYLGLRLFRRRGRTTTLTAAQQAREISRQAEVIDYAAMGAEPPLAQFVTTYVLGDDLFDDSFSIETAAGEFLGECGVGISETIGVGEGPKRVSAFEVWLFDKSDIQTVTKVLMSNHAYHDSHTFARLQAKGEPILVEKGKQIILETAAIQMVVTISDMEYGHGALPEESFFERLTLELAVWPKTAG